jgi:hypothetical protein
MHLVKLRKEYFSVERNCFFLNGIGKEQLITLTVNSLQKLVLEERKLFLNRLSEETIKYRFALNYSSLLYRDSLGQPYHSFFLDMNYNRNGDCLKQINGRNRVLLDMILHQRGINNDYPENLVHFEIKGFRSKRTEIENDKLRLMSTTSMSRDSEIVKMGYFYDNNRNIVCGYQLGFLIILKNASIHIEVYSNSHLDREIDVKV